MLKINNQLVFSKCHWTSMRISKRKWTVTVTQIPHSTTIPSSPNMIELSGFKMQNITDVTDNNGELDFPRIITFSTTWIN